MKSSIIFCGLIIVVAAQALPNARSKFIQEYEGRLKKDEELCAVLTEHFNFEGKYEPIYTGSWRHPTLLLNNQVSSIGVLPKCSLKAYSKAWKIDFMFTLTNLRGDKALGTHFTVKFNDEISSVSCYCWL